MTIPEEEQFQKYFFRFPFNKAQDSERDKIFFDAWVEQQSYPKAAKALAAQGIINTHLKKPYSVTTLTWCCARFMIENPKYSYEKVITKLYVTEDQWERYLLGRALYIYRQRPARFYDWINRFPNMKKYKAIYDRYFKAHEPKREIFMSEEFQHMTPEELANELLDKTKPKSE